MATQVAGRLAGHMAAEAARPPGTAALDPPAIDKSVRERVVSKSAAEMLRVLKLGNEIDGAAGIYAALPPATDCSPSKTPVATSLRIEKGASTNVKRTRALQRSATRRVEVQKEFLDERAAILVAERGARAEPRATPSDHDARRENPLLSRLAPLRGRDVDPRPPPCARHGAPARHALAGLV